MLRSRLALWLSIVIFPPLGLVLFGMRRGVGLVARLAGIAAIFAVAILELFYVYGMRIEWNGGMQFTRVRFELRGHQDRVLEESRARQHAAPPPAPAPAPLPAPAETAAPAPV